MKEDFLTLLHLKDRTRGGDIFNKFKEYVLENYVPIQKSGKPGSLQHSAIKPKQNTITIAASDGVCFGFIALCCNNPGFPDFELSLPNSSAGLGGESRGLLSRHDIGGQID